MKWFLKNKEKEVPETFFELITCLEKDVEDEIKYKINSFIHKAVKKHGDITYDVSIHDGSVIINMTVEETSSSNIRSLGRKFDLDIPISESKRIMLIRKRLCKS